MELGVFFRFWIFACACPIFADQTPKTFMTTENRTILRLVETWQFTRKDDRNFRVEIFSFDQRTSMQITELTTVVSEIRDGVWTVLSGFTPLTGRHPGEMTDRIIQAINNWKEPAVRRRH